MKFFGELIKARLENVTGAITSAAKGLIYFKSDTNRPVIDDGTEVGQLMMEKHLPEASPRCLLEFIGPDQLPPLESLALCQTPFQVALQRSRRFDCAQVVPKSVF